ncbi:MAG TPA: asparagine synthase (glutamine-hydrolyzing), partial [Niastella sp.]|nr:asparagine synthase (glutamine-hydrolyzing) [Niastella sp.]
MCGILGIFDRGNTRGYNVEAMGKIQQHRGPDHTGTYVDDNIILVHNRLSILDLSCNANQPFESADGKYLIIYNGEVYNFREIAAEIKTHKPGLQLRTSSDTEIILEAFLLWGTACIQKLNGMFAFAIYDKEKQELYIFRDRLGIKPLYYSFTDNVFCFSSELKGITQSLKKPFSLNTDAVRLFLNFGYIPSPFCIYNEVFKLGAGEFLVFGNGKIKKTKYWHIADHIGSSPVTNEHEAIEQLTGLIHSSIKYQLISDVPLGVFLSGGIDSSLISAMASRVAGIKLNTFTIGFEENKYDESKYARSIADYLGAHHTEYILS